MSFKEIFNINFGAIFSIVWYLLKSGGWVLVVLFFIWALYYLYRKEIEHQFVHSQSWVFLNIKVPKENLVSTLAVESIFSQMHALHSGLTFPQIYAEGRIQLWYSMEIISMGGHISYIVRTPKAAKELVQSAFYSQYPNAEIQEIEDYMANLDYDPERGDFDIWGCEIYSEKDDTIPIKTYKDFEHASAEQKIIEPLSSMFEGLSNMQPWEFFGIQINIQPLADPEWRPRGELKVKELTGEEVPHDTKFSDILLAPLNWVAGFSFKNTFFGGGHGGHGDSSENKPKNNWMSMTEAEKQRVTLIEKKIGKPGYKTKIRFMYIAPKDKFDATKKGLIIGSIRPLGSEMTNKLRPDTSKTWTGNEYHISPSLERPYLEYDLMKRKKFFFKGYKERDIHIGIPASLFNVEELATIYHFPLTVAPVAANIGKTESKKSQAPANLPVLEDF